jgi:hypothetical protein
MQRDKTLRAGPEPKPRDLMTGLRTRAVTMPDRTDCKALSGKPANESIVMTQDTSNGGNSALTNGFVKQLTPRTTRPVNKHYMRKSVLDVRGRRFELTFRVEVREVGRGPAIVIGMPKPDQ